MKIFSPRLFPVMPIAMAMFQNVSAVTLVNYVDGFSAPAGNPVATVNAGNTISSDITGVITGGNLGSAGNAIRTAYGSAVSTEIEAVLGAGKSGVMVSAAGRDADTLTAPAVGSLNNDYFQFSVTAGAGSTLMLNTLGFNLAVLSNINDTTSGFAFQLYASVNGGAYAAVGGTSTIASASYNLGNASAAPAQSFNLSGLNALGPIQSVAFRIWQGSDLNVDSTLALAYQDINVQGSVVTVPEPSIVGLIALGLVAGCARRSRRIPALI